MGKRRIVFGFITVTVLFIVAFSVIVSSGTTQVLQEANQSGTNWPPTLVKEDLYYFSISTQREIFRKYGMEPPEPINFNLLPDEALKEELEFLNGGYKKNWPKDAEIPEHKPPHANKQNWNHNNIKDVSKFTKQEIFEEFGITDPEDFDFDVLPDWYIQQVLDHLNGKTPNFKVKDQGDGK